MTDQLSAVPARPGRHRPRLRPRRAHRAAPGRDAGRRRRRPPPPPRADHRTDLPSSRRRPRAAQGLSGARPLLSRPSRRVTDIDAGADSGRAGPERTASSIPNGARSRGRHDDRLTICSPPRRRGCPTSPARRCTGWPTGTATACRSARCARTCDGDPDAELRMLAYNGSIPGPTLRVPQGSRITVDVRNDGDVETTVHWHGLRLENRYDGVPHETQATHPDRRRLHAARSTSPTPASTGTTRTCARTSRRRWACTARSSSSPPTPPTGPPVDRELTLTLDDLLVEDGHIAAVLPVRADLHRDGPVRQRPADQRRDRVHRHGDGRRGGAPVPGQHREHPAVQLRPARRADEAGRRRQRPVRAGDVHRRGPARAVGAGGPRRAVRRPRRGAARAPHPGPAPTTSARSPSPRRPTAAARRPGRSARCAPTRSSPPSAG